MPRIEPDMPHPPSVARILEEPAVRDALNGLPRPLVVKAIRQVIDEQRGSHSEAMGVAEIAEAAIQSARLWSRRTLRPAINATGIVLHTGLGRATLCESAQKAVAEICAGHTVVEVDPSTGKRGSRQDHVRHLLTELTGAESGLVVNNNAGATMLAVAALAAGKEVLISRGELVEIGGSFRIPDIIRASGANLVEVGTTNRTRLSDFQSAITEQTGLILRCHPSNFRQIGFVETVPIADLVKLGQSAGILVADDLGSGSLVSIASAHGEQVTTLSEAVGSGVDLVMASGDKLLGGPQAGIILGKANIVKRLESHPLARALRIDKLCLAALGATLREYLYLDTVTENIPALRYLFRSPSCLHTMATQLAGMIREKCNSKLHVDIVSSESEAGGGSLPGEGLASSCIALHCSSLSPDGLAASLRANEPPIFARIKDRAVLIDPRTLEEEHYPIIVRALANVVHGEVASSHEN